MTKPTIDKPTPTGGCGGKRDGAGRKAETTDGDKVVRKNITVDAQTIEILTGYGDGNFSEGLRRAARAIVNNLD